MIKRLYLANGHLAQPLDIRSDDVAVDSSIAALLDINLSVGDYCYLTLIENEKIEVIKITRFISWYSVAREQDNTVRQLFSTKASVVYKLTRQEIVDSVSRNDVSIYPDGYGAIQINNAGASWSIGYTKLNTSGLGGVNVLTPKEYEITIVDNDGMFGCCDASLTGAPFAGGQVFYLTSQLYTIDMEVEVVSNNPKRLDNGEPNAPFLALNIWQVPEDKMYNGIMLNEVNLFGGQKTYDFSDVTFALSADMLQVDIFGGEKKYDYTDGYFKLDCYVLEVYQFGNAVEYVDKYEDHYLYPTATLLSVSLN